MKETISKSPLKEPLLRLRGQSIDEQIDRLFNEKVMNYALFALCFFLLAMFAWIQAFNESRINPWLMSIVSGPVIAYCAVRFWQSVKEIKRLRLGRDGERAVAEQLDIVKTQGAIIFHDLLADGFNLDHVVLSTRGVFVVETKTRSKPVKGSPSVTFDGKTLLVNRFEPERNPITQAQGNARWLAGMLRASTGRGA